jgi:hypothetical protein
LRRGSGRRFASGEEDPGGSRKPDRRDAFTGPKRTPLPDGNECPAPRLAP